MTKKVTLKHSHTHSANQLPMTMGTATVGERGQVVIPADVRELVGLRQGDKLVVFSPRPGLLSMVRASAFRSFLGQLTKHLGRV